MYEISNKKARTKTSEIKFSMHLKDGVITVTSHGKNGEKTHKIIDSASMFCSGSYYTDEEYRAAFAAVEWSSEITEAHHVI